MAVTLKTDLPTLPGQFTQNIPCKVSRDSEKLGSVHLPRPDQLAHSSCTLPQESNADFREGCENYNSHKYTLAFPCFEKVPLSDLDYWDAQFWLARSYYKVNNYKRAKDLFFIIPQNHDFYIESQYLLGCCYFALGSYLSAIQCLTKITSTSDSPAGHLLGQCYFWQGDSSLKKGLTAVALHFFREVPQGHLNYMRAQFNIRNIENQKI